MPETEGLADFALAFVRERYGPCPDPAENPEGEERWHARAGLLIDALTSYARSTRTPEQAEAEAREVLRELSDKFNGVDSGTCTICHGHRLCDTKGNVGPCENKTCLSHRITAALLASEPTAKNLENLKRRLLERLHERFARREELKTLLDEEFSRSEPKEKV